MFHAAHGQPPPHHMAFGQAPAGWNPPYQGQPPPMPSGFVMNPQAWVQGSWQFNPAYAHVNPTQFQQSQHSSNGRASTQPTATWAVGVGWQGPGAQQAQQQSQDFNPYKRAPKQPSEEYMSTKLSDNPLGLSGMVPSDNYPPATPWVWNPGPALAEDVAVPQMKTNDQSDRRAAEEARGTMSSRQASRDDPASQSSRHQSYNREHRTDSIGRRSSVDKPSDSYPRREPTPSRHSSMGDRYGDRHNSMGDRPGSTRPVYVAPDSSAYQRESPPSRHGSSESINSSKAPAPSFDRPLGRPKDPNSAYQQRFVSPGLSDTSTLRDSPSKSSPSSRSSMSSDRTAVGSPAPYEGKNTQPESFTSKMDLKTTFSTNIVRTPDYYQQNKRSTSSTDAPSRTGSALGKPSYGSAHTGVSQIDSQMGSLRINTNTSRDGLQRHSSMPPSSFSSTGSSASSLSGSRITDEPASVLSPLMLNSTPKPSSRPIGRGFSVPEVGGSSLGVIPETSTMDPYQPPRPRSRHSSTHNTSPLGPNRESMPSPIRSNPTPSPNRSNPTPSPINSGSTNSPHRSSSSARSSPIHPHHSDSPRSSNPLPRPPADYSDQILSGHSRVSSPRISSPAPGAPPTRVRIGFWNKRGDYLTRTNHIVYAPPDKAYPAELAHYPGEKEGYRDHHGNFMPWQPRLELPESLPRHGASAQMPYKVFIAYEYKK